MRLFTKSLYGIVLAALLVAACKKQVDISLPNLAPQPVLYAMFGDSVPLKVLVSRTYGMYDTVDSFHLPSDSTAQVDLYVNGQFSEALLYKDNYFTAQHYVPKSSDSVAIRAITLAHDSLTANAKIPHACSLSSFSYIDSAFFEADALQSQLTLSFKDDATEENYYELYVCFSCDHFFDQYASNYKSGSPIIIDEDILEYEPSRIVFSDKLFNGQQLELPLSFAHWHPCVSNDVNGKDTQTQLTLYFVSISKSYYLYRKAMYKQNHYQHTTIWDNAMEPFNCYSNVAGGYGVVGAYAYRKYLLDGNI